MRRSKLRRNDVPANEHVARYCHPQRVIRDAATGTVTGLFPEVFKLRTHQNETYLSLNHFEYFVGDTDHQYREILAVMRIKFKRPPEPVIARLNAGKIVACGISRQRQLRVRRRGNDKDPSYASLEGLPQNNGDEILLAKLAGETCIEVRSGSEIDA